MAAAPFEHAEQARLVLRTIVAEHGPQVLSSPSALANLLSDLLPDAPRIARILVAAAQDQIADELREHTSAGMDATTASKLAAGSFAAATMFAPDACAWVAEEFALALGLAVEPIAPSAVPSATVAMAPGSDPTMLPPLTELASDTGSAPAAGAVSAWTAVVSADRAYFDGVVAGRDPDAAPLEFPEHYQDRTVQLAGAQMRIGRRSASRGLAPEIDLTGPPTDPGISHLHAVLIAQHEGTWSVLDTGSANGTQVNGRDIASGEPAPLRDGDSICLGAWTRLTLHRG
jgi:FHA domain